MPLIRDDHFAVVVGINRYPGLTNLNYARGDAEAFADWLRTKGGVVEQNLHLVVVDDAAMQDVEQIDAKPRRAHIFQRLSEFRDRMDAVAEEDPGRWEKSRLYIFVSGHGFAPNARDSALLCADAGNGSYENVSCAGLVDYFTEHTSFKEIVVFADCCRNRVPNTPPGLPPWPRSGAGNPVVTVLGLAAEYQLQSFEPPRDASADVLRGYYTRALLEGLTGKATNESTGHVDSQSLQDFLEFRVRELSVEKRYPQRARMFGDVGRVILQHRDDLPRVRPEYSVSISVGSPPASEMAIFQDEDPLASHTFVEGEAWSLSLPKGLYQLRRMDGEEEPGLVRSGHFMVIGNDEAVEL